MRFVFYDTETTGTDTAFDQILQFAAICTDEELNEVERLEVRSKLLPYVVPSPGAVKVNGISVARLLDPELPSHYSMIRIIEGKLRAWSPATFLGYNSLRFDENLFRQALYQTLHDPYLTNTSGNCRTDVLKMVQATSLFAPAALIIPTDEKEKPVFKLDRVAPANGFNHENAHDALADVQATIYLCKIIKQWAPSVWASFLRFSSKAAVADYTLQEPAFCLAEFYQRQPHTWLVTRIGANKENPSEIYVYDLSVEPESILPLTDDELKDRLAKAPRVLRRIRSNACPILVPVGEAPEGCAGKALSSNEVMRRVELLQAAEGLADRLCRIFSGIRDPREPSPHVELQIYDGFFTFADRARMAQFHAAPWENRPAIADQFDDARLKTMASRLIYVERPDLLSENARTAHAKQIAERLLGTDPSGSWLCLEKAIEQIDVLLPEADDAGRLFLAEFRSYLAEQLRHIEASQVVS
jgi:exodeoxyribonuclease I